MEIEFSRSRTLHAFESRLPRTRVRRRDGSEPDMNRTPLGGVRFYHLEIGGGAAGDGLALIMGDRSGEEYREIADDASSSRLRFFGGGPGRLAHGSRRR